MEPVETEEVDSLEPDEPLDEGALDLDELTYEEQEIVDPLEPDEPLDEDGPVLVAVEDPDDMNKMMSMFRMLPDEEIANRFGRHKFTDATAAGTRAVRRKFLETALWLDQVLPPCRAKAMALTELESCESWAIKAVLERAPVMSE